MILLFKLFLVGKCIHNNFGNIFLTLRADIKITKPHYFFVISEYIRSSSISARHRASQKKYLHFINIKIFLQRKLKFFVFSWFDFEEFFVSTRGSALDRTFRYLCRVPQHTDYRVQDRQNHHRCCIYWERVRVDIW